VELQIAADRTPRANESARPHGVAAHVKVVGVSDHYVRPSPLHQGHSEVTQRSCHSVETPNVHPIMLRCMVEYLVVSVPQAGALSLASGEQTIWVLAWYDETG